MGLDVSTQGVQGKNTKMACAASKDPLISHPTLSRKHTAITGKVEGTVGSVGNHYFVAIAIGASMHRHAIV